MFLMLLGIPYHAALLFQNEVSWYATVASNSAVARFIIALIHIFRMPAFFLVSGYLAAIILMRSDPREWLKGRYVTLGIPLTFGLMILHPIQVLVPAAAASEDLTAALRGKGVGHLWFLFALLGISTLTVLVRDRLPRTKHLPASVVAIGAYVGVALCVAIATVAREWIGGGGIPLGNTINSIIWGIAYGFPYFLLGMLMVKRHDIAQKLTPRATLSYIAIGTLIVAYVIIMPLKVDTLASTIAAGLLAIPMTTSILLACSRHLYFRSSKIDLLTRSSFTVYLVHHPIIVVLGVLSAGAPLPWYVHYAAICAVTWLLSFAIWYGVRRVPVMNILLGAEALNRRRTIGTPALT
jgi:glucan biosynthesis protein C